MQMEQWDAFFARQVDRIVMAALIGGAMILGWYGGSEHIQPPTINIEVKVPEVVPKVEVTRGVINVPPPKIEVTNSVEVRPTPVENTVQIAAPIVNIAPRLTAELTMKDPLKVKLVDLPIMEEGKLLPPPKNR